MTDKIIRIKIESGDSKAQIDSLDRSMVGLGAATDKTTAEINQLSQVNTQMTRTAQGVAQATGSMGTIAQQAGFQIQDFANQVAGGQSALLAFGQQAPQFLGTFGPGGAVFGAIIAVSAAIGGVLVNAIKSAKEEAQELPGEVKKFAEEIGKKFADVDFSSRADLARVEIGKLNLEYEKTAEKLAAVTLELKDLDTFGPSSKYVKSGEQYTRAWRDANYEVKENAAKLEIIKQKLDQVGIISQTGLGTESLDNLTTAAGKTVSASETLTKTLKQQAIALEEGQLQARLYAAANYLELDSINSLPPAIRDQIIHIYALEQQQKATAASTAALTAEMMALGQEELRQLETDKRNAERAARDQERIDQRIANMHLETQTLASENALRQAVQDGAFTQEEARIAYQTSARILAASNEYQQLMDLDNISNEQKLQAKSAFEAQLTEINAQGAASREILAEQERKTRLYQMGQLGDSLMSLGQNQSKGIFKIGQGLALAQAAIALPTAVMESFKNGGGYPWGLVPAAAMAATGLKNIQAIKNASIGGSSASVYTGSGGSSGASPTLPTTPQAAAQVGTFEIAGLSGLKEQLANLDNDEVLPVSFTKRLVASLDSVQRLQGA